MQRWRCAGLLGAGLLGLVAQIHGDPAMERPLAIRYHIDIIDPARGLVRALVAIEFEKDQRELELVDAAAARFQSNGVPRPRPQCLQCTARGADGRELSCSTDGEGTVKVDLDGRNSAVVERTLRFLDRSSGVAPHHPWASSLTGSSALFYGGDLALVPRDPEYDAGVEVQFIVPDGWKVLSPWGRETRFSPPDLRSLSDNFFLAAKDFSAAGRTIGSMQFLVAGPSDWMEAGGLGVGDEVFELLESALDTFGDLDAGRYAIFLLPLSGTSHRRGLLHRGANAKGSLVAYVDHRDSVEAGDHPLSVVAHEIVHWWNPRSLRPMKNGMPAWFTEGLTSYYEKLLLLRSGVIGWDELAQAMVDEWSLSGEKIPSGREISLEEACERFGEDPVCTTLAYARGACLGFAVDLWMREHSEGWVSLDSWMRSLLRRSNDGAQSESAPTFLSDLWSLAGAESLTVLRQWLTARETVPIEHALGRLGYRVERRARAQLGIRLEAGPNTTVGELVSDGPAAACLQTGDVILTLDGLDASTPLQYRKVLFALEPDRDVEVRIRRGEEEMSLRVRLGSRLEPRAIPLEQLGAEHWMQRTSLENPFEGK